MSYLTDEEKAEAIKKWWSENGTAVLGGLVLGIAGLFGWNWWTGQQDAKAEAASELFSVALTHIDAGQYMRATAVATELTERGGRTPYTSLGWTLLADLATREQDSLRAVDALEQARAKARDRGFRQVLSLRLARHLAALERHAEAEAVLSEVSADAFSGLVAEIRGDIAAARGDSEAARRYYLEAIAAGLDSEFLRLKLDELSA